MASHLHKGSFGLSFALSIACTISILLISVVTVCAQTFSPTGELRIPRSYAAAAQLLNGKVLVAGGYDNTGVTRGTAELFDPTSTVGNGGALRPTRSPVPAPGGFTAHLLKKRKVVGTGGPAKKEIA